MPRRKMYHTMTLPTTLTPKPTRAWRMHLARFTPLSNAPPIIWNRLVDCFGGQCIVATEHIAWSEFLHVVVLHTLGADGTIDFVPYLRAEFGLDPRAETAAADRAGMGAE